MRVAVIGAGVTGLTAAYELSKKGIETEVFEKNNCIGGLAAVIPVGYTEVEKYYHHIFVNDKDIIKMAAELKLRKRMIWKSPSNGIYINDSLYPFTSPLDLLNFKGLSLPDRIKLGLLVLKAGKLDDWKELEKITAKEWIIKNAGKNVYNNIWEPLLYSKFGKDSDEISAVWLWNKFKLRGSSREKKLGKEMLGYMDGSFGCLYKKMHDRIRFNGGRIFLSNKVKKLISKPDGKIMLEASEKTGIYDKVIMTAAPENLRQMLNIDTKLFSSIYKIKYKANICMMLHTKEKISPYYWITVAEKNSPFVLVLEHTNLFMNEEYNGHITYLSNYLDETDDLFNSKDDEIEKVFLDKLQKMFPDFRTASILDTKISKAKYAQPVVYKEYSKSIPKYKTHIRNLYLATMSQIYPEDRGQNYAIREGIKIANMVIEEGTK
jgi:protoporphyrinogen oxidase